MADKKTANNQTEQTEALEPVKPKRPKMKPRGGNSPVIGDNGLHLQAGDAAKTAKTLEFLMFADPYFGDIFSEIDFSDEETLFHQILALASTPIDLANVETMKRRFVGFVAYCMVNDVKFGNQTVYTAIGIDKDDVYNWENGVSRTKAHCDFIKKVKRFCGAYRELLGATGGLNPVTLVWWQKNYDGLVDQQQIVVKPAAADIPDASDLQKRITGTVVLD